jgi:hypothetical protein
MVLDMLESQGDVFASLDDQSWNDALTLLEEYAGLENPKEPSEYYTDEFVK